MTCLSCRQGLAENLCWIFIRILYLLCSLNIRCVLIHYSLGGEPGQKSQYESVQSHASEHGVVVDDICLNSTNSSIAATMETEISKIARLSKTGTGSKQTGNAMTQHERDDLLRGVGTQFDSVADFELNEGRSSIGREHC